MAYRIDKKRSLILLCALVLSVLAVRGCLFANASDTENSVEIRKAELSFPENYSIKVYNTKTRSIMSIGLEEYVFGVIAAEMPASYEPEALKAQAVAARTFAVKHLDAVCGGDATPCGLKGADVCTSHLCCQAWKSLNDMRQDWGAGFDKYSQKVYSAVADTAGIIAVYGGKPLQALYHSSSGGMTEDCANVFAVSLPYLKGVASPGEERYSRFEEETTLSVSEFVKVVNKEYPSAVLTVKNAEASVKITARFSSGRVKSVKLGSAIITGREFREAFELNSANFQISFSDGKIVIRMRGYGHGVGLSQSGADAMARNGSTYEDIIKHYYTGVELRHVDG